MVQTERGQPCISSAAAQFDNHTRTVILSVAVFQAQRRISRLAGPTREPNCATTISSTHPGSTQVFFIVPRNHFVQRIS
jgi:hypothetical protein